MHTPLQALRALLLEEGHDALCIPSWDMYHNEYAPDHARCLAWATGFTGSNGIFVLTQTQAALFTDGRYLLQAEKELQGKDIAIIDLADMQPASWCNLHLKDALIAIDGRLLSVIQADRWRTTLKKSGNQLTLLPYSYAERLWQDRPLAPPTLLSDYPLTYAGKSREKKLSELHRFLQEHALDSFILTAPDEICWLLNIRGNDVPHTPVALCFALVSLEKVILFGIFTETPAFLPSSIQYQSWDRLSASLASHQAIGYDPESFPALYLPEEHHWQAFPSPCLLPKACKNPAEIAAITQAHVHDGAAVTEVLYLLSTGQYATPLRETDIAGMLLAARKKQPDFLSESFATIAGFNANGAVIHYHATAESHAIIEGAGLLLIDSGGQYEGGTTDITRVIAFGTIAPEQKRDYTLVLQGHIALAMAVFPKGTTGQHLDAFARMPLWQHGLDYAHGTGHGVGCCLSVHEGPQRISKASSPPLEVGMVLSNEPGVYHPGKYGIRLENLMVVEPHGTYLGFRTLTLVPFARNLIDDTLLSPKEKAWLTQYHQSVYHQLAPLLSAACRDWLMHTANSFSY